MKFPTVVADPPWPYKKVELWGRPNVDDHYPTLSVDQIAAMPVEKFTTEKAHLWLWTTQSHIENAFRVCRAWGFEYKALLTWCKEEYGVGRYFRTNTEFVMFGARGNLDTLTTDQSTWLVTGRGRHSEKPEIFTSVIERNSPPPYLYLFARWNQYELFGEWDWSQDWELWGNEVGDPLGIGFDPEKW